MPSRGGALGGELWTALIALAAILAVVARRRWRMAVERAQEVRRLVERAAEEAARAEAEAEAEAAALWRYEGRPVAVASAAAVVDVGKAGAKSCAVCYSHTTTRCSRCKAVRYCSGRCQIIHWRQGHKDDCRPPDIHHDTEEGGHHFDAVYHAKSRPCGDTPDNSFKEPSEAFIGRYDSFDSSCSSSLLSEGQKVSNVADGEDSYYGPSVSSSGSFTHFYKEISDANSRNSVCDQSFPVECGKPSSLDNSSSKLREVANTSTAICARILPSANVSKFDGQASHSRKLAGKPRRETSLISNSSGPGERDNVGPKVPPDCQGVDDALFLNSSTIVGDPLLLKDTGKENFESRHSHISSSEHAEPISSQSFMMSHTASTEQDGLVVRSYESNTNDYLLKSRAFKPPSKFDALKSAKSHSLGTGLLDCGVPEPASVNCTVQTEKLAGRAINSVSSGSSLKMSVGKGTQQEKQSKPSKHCKMLFPYELFVKLYNEKVDLRPCGFANLGNSCYANVVLQCLVFTRPLTAYLLQGLHKKNCQKKNWCFTCEFENLVMEVKRAKAPLSPTGILSQIHNIGSHLGHGKEEDAHEFLRYAIDAMQRVCLEKSGADELGKLAEETSLLQLTFGGYLRSKIKCLRCHIKSARYERMMDLTVEIQGDIENLDAALHQFTRTELLDGDNKYQCDRCKSYERAKKKLTVAEAPNILTIVLKRFQSGKFGKINKAVKFPEILNLAPYLSNPSDKSPVYSLYAAVVHVDVMNAAFSGHYVCYVKNHQGRWFKADDSSVKPVDLERVLSKGAYMLLYGRCSPRAPSLIREMMSNNSAKMRSKSFNGVISGRAGANPPSRSVSSRVWDEFDPLDPRSGKYFRTSPAMTDSSSDSSSLFSCSDEGSWSTESTRDSTSTDDFSGNFSPSRFSEDDCCSYTPSPDMHPCELNSNESLSVLHRCTPNSFHPSQGESVKSWTVSYGSRTQGGSLPPILSPDSTKSCRKLTEQCSGRETVWAKPYEAKSSLLTRRPTRDKAAQVFL